MPTRHYNPSKLDPDTRKQIKALADQKRVNYTQKIADKLIEKLKVASEGWTLPWADNRGHEAIPINPLTQKHYRGVNLFALLSYMEESGVEDPRFCTASQALQIGEREGKPKSVFVMKDPAFKTEVLLPHKKTYVRTEDQIEKIIRSTEEKGLPTPDRNKLRTVEKMFWDPRTIYNGESITGLPELGKDTSPINTAAIIESLIKTSGAKVVEGESDTAFYGQATDTINIPSRETFSSAEEYYSTLLNLWGYWVQDDNRNGEQKAECRTGAGLQAYAMEELRVQCFSLLASASLGTKVNLNKGAKFMNIWEKVAQAEPDVIVNTLGQGAKSHSIVMDFINGEQPKVNWFPEKDLWDQLTEDNTNTQLGSDENGPSIH